MKKHFSTRGIFLIKLTLMCLVLGESAGRYAVAQSTTPAEPSLPPLPVETSSSSELAAPDPTVGESYILGVGDYLRVDVFNIPDYSGEFRVLSSGNLNIPIVGAIDVEGLSLQQAKVQIEQTLEPYVQRPVVTLSVLETRPIQIAIAGEVHRPGSYRISAQSGTNVAAEDIPTLTQAIELAGGITQLADIRQIEVQRRLPRSSAALVSSATLLADQRHKENKSQTVAVNLWNLLKEGNLNEDLQLQDGDRIIIPTASNLNSDEAAELATASFSPDEISVNVVGEVESPGNIRIPPNTPLNQAILAAGGFNNRARKGTVRLVRLNLNGTVSQSDIDIDFAQGINEETNPSLRPNDTVIVQRSGVASVGDAFSSVLSPLNFVLRLLGI
ncbi:polysaccharide export protein [Leptolyngbyaceae cyanobacterium CCMR0082]|uniref:Polysaccharide export protein n=2 Tax=Adonisia turfae TaxID=2950184 RepID=A0A6M0SGL5_9CYAN|nr:SLBB domain-containing protein [Adonisia turfae]MDV3347922.1 SLBB domain-containing protein [Leptothoe sp. LEGE 181152]NEZ58356.1 polysaccharide export protein [Adonisia turfae CCMR0081]NEZ67657.1 polysaccharide export protein [Adonisia turfae CCMR0082]